MDARDRGDGRPGLAALDRTHRLLAAAFQFVSRSRRSAHTRLDGRKGRWERSPPGTQYYFRPERVEEVRERLDLPRIDDETIRDLFLAFVNEMDMSASYKPVMLRALLDLADADGRARVDDLARAFHEFYRQRQRAGLTVEGARSRMRTPDSVTPEVARQVMLEMPFRKFGQKKFLEHDRKDVAFVRFAPALWRRLSPDDRAAIRSVCDAKIAEYYERLP